MNFRAAAELRSNDVCRDNGRVDELTDRNGRNNVQETPQSDASLFAESQEAFVRAVLALATSDEPRCVANGRSNASGGAMEITKRKSNVMGTSRVYDTPRAAVYRGPVAVRIELPPLPHGHFYGDVHRDQVGSFANINNRRDRPSQPTAPRHCLPATHRQSAIRRLDSDIKQNPQKYEACAARLLTI